MVQNLADTLAVMEAFYTIQGEGIHTGKAAYFIRLAGCDVGCTWCDVKESWPSKPEQRQAVDTIVQDALSHPARIAVITGGEPCMQNLEPIIESLHTGGFKVHIETSGAYPMTGQPDWICVSPKKFKKPLPSLLAVAHELKVIVAHSSDFRWAEQNAALADSQCRLLLQPEYGKSEKMMPLIVDYVLKHPRWNISLQTHKIIGIP